MKTLTPESAKELIDSLADKELSFGCEIIHLHNRKSDVVVYIIDDDNIGTKNEDLHCTKEEIEILGHPILIGDILEKIYEIEKDGNTRRWCRARLCEKWYPFGFTKSLQSIYAEGTRTEKSEACPASVTGVASYRCEKVLKPEVAELFLFIKSLKL